MTRRDDSQIGLFLFRIKDILHNGTVQIIPREQNLNFMAERGISQDEVFDIITALTVDDCFDGPEPDRDPRWSSNWTVAEFGPVAEYGKLYLKLSICCDALWGKVISVKLYAEREGR